MGTPSRRRRPRGGWKPHPATGSLPGSGRGRLAASLTERELEVLGCVGEGLSNAQIAERLYLSEATVKGYVSRMLDKLGCANRTQAGLLAHDAGIVGR
jgi:DNA-binding NarL/FixJ family response regulator